MNKLILILCLTTAVCSCSKKDKSSTESASVSVLLQNKWTIDSVYLYPSTGMTSNAIYAYKITTTQYSDFRADGKVYSYGGVPISYLDTTVYRLLPDNKTFVVNTIINGTVSTKSDTGYILKITTGALVYYNQNAAREYGKVVLKR